MTELHWTRRTLLGTSAALALSTTVPAPAATAPGPAVGTTNGPVTGVAGDGATAFKGIRYGAPPTGALRFLPPRKPKRWRKPMPATAFGAPAMQMPMGTAGQEPRTDLAKALQAVYPTLEEWKDNSEDCLFLNVWTPAPSRDSKRPVMVWLHGGGFAYGSGSWPMYDGANLARRGDVVVVTLNHRLNAFGYLELAEVFGPAYAQSGNAGMLDIVAALEWVRDNIANFGGDAGNVTIFGESGGGAKVSTLMAMPSANGLFHKAIVESGPGLRGVPRANATQDAKDILAELKITGVKALQAAPAADIVKACFAVAARRGPGSEIRFLGPVVDGTVLPSNPFDPAAPAQSAGIPLIIGTNKDEMTLFVAGQPWFGKLTDDQLAAQAGAMAGPKAPALIAALKKAHPDYSPSYLMAELMTTTFMWGDSITLASRKAAQKAPVYMYMLQWETPVGNGVFKTPHTLEIPLVFDNVENSRPLVGPGPQPQAVADQMSSAWIAFAHTGNPNNAHIPDWPAYDTARRATMMFDVKSGTVDDPYAEVRAVLEG
ncbi:MAG TPA: carboxylesterase/lipase family protein [Rhizomicrobium sp.]|nr:carboxylesterase/lipase family protein [Rhizomicrobium sp.]